MVAHSLLTSEFSPIEIELDPVTGLPASIRSSDGSTCHIDVRCDVQIEVGGTERRGPLGGLEYVGVDVLRGPTRSGDRISSRLDLDRRTFTVRTRLATWTLIWEYAFAAGHPQVELAIRLQSSGSQQQILRNLTLDVHVGATPLGDWRLHAPGNQLRPDLPLLDLTRQATISPAGGLRGSTGLVGLEHPASSTTFVFWPLSRREVGSTSVAPEPDGVTLRHRTDLAGVVDPGDELDYRAIHLDLCAISWPGVVALIPDWLADLGLAAPDDGPAWIKTANIYEVQIGFSVFRGGLRYAPYPRAQDLLADLDRIQALGYDTLQLMPAQPYPSYNVHDYADISTSYGEESVLQEIVRVCHERGMRVIADILVHGVVDREAILAAADAVRAGPYVDRIDEVTTGTFDADINEMDDYHVAFSRHILDFEPYWSAGSPERHPLVDAHPDWFCRDSSGEIIGVYTKAFDLAHPGWQDFFIASALEIAKRLDIDGFRFDAPTYNDFANWSERTRSRASVSRIGCLSLFSRLRRALKAVKPDAVMYTEPSGVLLRTSMDVTYNYDEQWLIGAVMNPVEDPTDQAVGTARQVGEWLALRDAALPRGSLTAHHVDSHDTFWWPLAGQKWRREQYGLDATAAWMALFALSGGPYMTFVGGEQGIEAQVRRVAELRSRYPELAQGSSDRSGISVDSDDVYAVVRRNGSAASVVLVSLARRHIDVRVRLAAPPGDLPEGRRHWRDVYPDGSLPMAAAVGETDVVLALTLAPFQISVLRAMQ